MFAFLEGSLAYKSPSLVCLLVNGVGYELHISLRTFDQIRDLERCRIYTHLQVREDAWVLYGFAEEQERSTFRQLLSINGVGAGTARIILSSLSPSELERAVVTGDSAMLEKVKGIGAKTAQRIILELKGKINVQSLPQDTKNSSAPHNTTSNDALIALVNLGINKAAAEGALKKIKDAEAMPVEELVKQALRNL